MAIPLRRLVENTTIMSRKENKKRKDEAAVSTDFPSGIER